MNGRVYDPTIGRFLSADPIIQTLAISQAINPFSYVMNMPLTLIDPSGYSWLSKLFSGIGSFWKKWGQTILSVVLSFFVGPFISALIIGAIYGGNFQSFAIGFAVGMIAGAIAGPAGGGFAKAVGLGGSGFAATVLRGAIVGGLAGGISSVAMGGSFGAGFSGGAIGGALSAGLKWSGGQQASSGTSADSATGGLGKGSPNVGAAVTTDSNGGVAEEPIQEIIITAKRWTWWQKAIYDVKQMAGYVGSTWNGLLSSQTRTSTGATATGNFIVAAEAYVGGTTFAGGVAGFAYGASEISTSAAEMAGYAGIGAESGEVALIGTVGAISDAGGLGIVGLSLGAGAGVVTLPVFGAGYYVGSKIYPWVDLHLIAPLYGF